jgi:hypothetical protein
MDRADGGGPIMAGDRRKIRFAASVKRLKMLPDVIIRLFHINHMMATSEGKPSCNHKITRCGFVSKTVS